MFRCTVCCLFPCGRFIAVGKVLALEECYEQIIAVSKVLVLEECYKVPLRDVLVHCGALRKTPKIYRF